ncbi:MAG: hypothetical protein ABFR47_10045 [Verrucomicrobiota bacterium]
MMAKAQTCSRCRQPGHNARTCSNPPIENAPDPSILPRRRGGGQPGNTNALKHGFYAARFDDEDLQALADLPDKANLDAEIELIRVTIDRAMAYYHRGLELKDFVPLGSLILRATSRLAQLSRIQKQYRIGEQAQEELIKGFINDFWNAIDAEVAAEKAQQEQADEETPVEPLR